MMDTLNGLPTGWVENEHGVFWRENSMGNWFDMDSAPRDGAPFVWLRPTFVVGPKDRRRVEMTVTVLHRRHHDCESGGYWYGSSCSVPDHYARYGWWSHAASMTHDGRLVMPHKALEYVIERLEPVAA